MLTDSIPVAVRYMLLSALGFALMAASVKAVSGYGIPVMEIVAARAIISLAISYVDVKRKGISIWGNNKPLLIARGGIGAVSLMVIYFAVTTLPLAEATILQYTYPAFTAVLALIFLKERIHLATIICIGLSILGLLVMMRPGMDSNADPLPLLSVGAALLGAFGSAAAYVIVRQLSRSEDGSVIIFYFPLIALPASLILLGDDFVMPGTEALILLIMVGIFTQVGQIGMTKAMAAESAGKATAYSYVQVIFSAILGIIFFAETPTFWTLMGGSLIITGALINALMKR
ncbi:DMT family transporter [Aliamphritea ceti]|uniref:DMT family transporter n=1 Tax=Aliamphritea ceti TaxID=1524258 RepID=UPI0021C2D996|nr:DMT family transporter [Aliamphritea ceti]